MLKEVTCITCPKGCEVLVTIEGDEIIDIKDYECNRGREYAILELTSPVRNFATSMIVEKGDMPIVSCRLSKSVSKDLMFDILDVIKKNSCVAPIHIGDVLIENVCESGADVIATRNIGLNCDS